MEKVISKHQKCCSTCSNYNQGKGPNSLKPKSMNFFIVDPNEKCICMADGQQKKSMYGLSCNKYIKKL